MILLAIFRLIIIFPFIIYFIYILTGTTKKKPQLISSGFYLISMFFIVKYNFNTLWTGLVLGSIITFLIVLTFQISYKNYKTIIPSVFIRNFFKVVGKLYPYIYIILVIIGIIIENFR